MSVLDLVAQFPIQDMDLPIRELRQEAATLTRAMATEQGYTVVGEPVFELRDFAAGLFLECRSAVEEVTFGGGNHER